MTIPENLENVMVTFRVKVHYGEYLDKYVTEIVTKRGYWSDIFGHFSIPPSWRMFNDSFLPHGFGGHRVRVEEVISWRPCKHETEV